MRRISAAISASKLTQRFSSEVALPRRRVGIIGYGAIGRYLARAVQEDPICQQRCEEISLGCFAYFKLLAQFVCRLELAFVCNPRSPHKVRDDASIPAAAVLDDLRDFASKGADLIVEVAHPSVSADHGVAFLEQADYMVSSVTTFADAATERAMREAAASGAGHGVYIPAGALWGARDIQKMADRGNLAGLTVTMKKAPHHLKLAAGDHECGRRLAEVAASGKAGETVLYEGPVRGLAPLAPSNTNTMAAAALAAHTLGMDGTVGRLVVDPALDAHIIEIEVEGAGKPGAPPFRCVTRRYNPAAAGAVTGDATYASFLSSMLDAGGRGAGLHFC